MFAAARAVVSVPRRPVPARVDGGVGLPRSGRLRCLVRLAAPRRPQTFGQEEARRGGVARSAGTRTEATRVAPPSVGGAHGGVGRFTAAPATLVGPVEQHRLPVGRLLLLGVPHVAGRRRPTGAVQAVAAVAGPALLAAACGGVRPSLVQTGRVPGR